jgi:hypothetical protein
MKTYLLILLVIITSHLSSQTKGVFTYIIDKDTSFVPFLYMGNDTLDYVDGGAGRTKINFDEISYSDISKKYLIKGSMVDAQTGETFEDFGQIILGKIILVEGKTWLGIKRTGAIIRTGQEYRTTKSNFSFYVNDSFNESIIFTMLGYSIVEIPFKDLLKKYFRK